MAWQRGEYAGNVTGVPGSLGQSSAALAELEQALEANRAEPELQVTVLVHLADRDLRRVERHATALQAVFEPANYAANLRLLDGLSALADEAGCSMVQLSLAWLLAQGDHVVPIPGTTRIDHLEENLGAGAVTLSGPLLQRLGALINQRTVTGPRYNAATQTEVDTEEF